MSSGEASALVSEDDYFQYFKGAGIAEGTARAKAKGAKTRAGVADCIRHVRVLIGEHTMHTLHAHTCTHTHARV